jgi:hypothetical protein
MRKYSNEIIDKIELIKEIIVSRSILRNIRDDIKWEIDIVPDAHGENIHEIALYVKVIDIDCIECDFESINILNEIERYKNSIHNSISRLSFDQKLNVVKFDQSLRGVLVSSVNYAQELITIEYGIYIDTIS